MFKYRSDLDGIKGIAIIAVLLFHCGLVKTGYLGVDAFFVINGFLIIPSIMRQFKDKTFTVSKFLEKRLVRLLPLVILLGIASLVLGCIFLLPFELERLARSVVASCFLSENLRSAFTWGNYWEVVNDYSPLFHLWYVGILFEFYIFLPIIFYIVEQCCNKLRIKWLTMEKALWFFTIISLGLYLLPIANDTYKFYLLPFRFFELSTGGLIAIYADKLPLTKSFNKVQVILSIALIFIIFSSLVKITETGIGHPVLPIAAYGGQVNPSDPLILPAPVLLILTVLITTILISQVSNTRILCNSLLVYLGKRSYSLFIWHQFVLAFMRNLWTDNISITFVIIFVVLTMLISELSYQFVEKQIIVNHTNLIKYVLISLLLSLPAGYVYYNGGVVRDVPELDLTRKDGHIGVAIDYCDIPYKYTAEFPTKKEEDKINVLIVGNSFARDFCNILRESHLGDKMNFAYCSFFEQVKEQWVVNADYICSMIAKESIPSWMLEKKKPSCMIYGIGTKNFGKCNNQYYSQRWSENYFKNVVPLQIPYWKANEIGKEHWGENYIDLLTPALADANHVRIFTDDNKYISQDCKHLTRAGAKWYARILELDKFFVSHQ